MHRRTLILLLVGAISLGGLGIMMVVQANEKTTVIEPQPSVSSHSDKPMQSGLIWEYKTICVQGPFTNAVRTLNEYGKKGWEVVDWEDTDLKYYLLKRMVPK